MCLIAVPIPAFAYHTPTQAPYGVNASNDSTAGTFTIGILGSDGAEDSPPENYTIFFSLSSGITETNSFCVTTSFGHQTNTWQYYTFSLDDLKYYFNNPAGNNIYYRVRANNETDNIVSTLTNENSWSLYAGSPFDYNQENWSAPTGTSACNPYVVTTTTTTTTSSTTTTTVPDTTTTSSTTTSSTTSSTTTSTTTTTTTTTTLPPPPPPTTTTTLAPVIVEINGEEVEYTQAEVDDGTVDRDIERQANEEEWGCYVTDIALERGDCPAYNDFLKQEEEKEEVIIEIKDEEITDTETELPDDDFVVFEVESDDEIKDIEDEVIEEIVEEEIKIDVKELEEEFKFEEEEIVIEIPEEIIIIIEEDVEEEVIEDELDEEILTDDTKSETEIQEEDELVIEEEVIEQEVELTEEEIQEEVKEVEEKIEAIQGTNVEELKTEQVVEIIEEVNDAGLENLDEVSEDVLEVVAEVVEQSIAKADELTEEQQEVVAEVLGFTETEDVQVIAEAVKTDKTVAKAVEEYVERVVENADIEDYNLADVTTEITFESLAQGDFSVIIDVDLDAINLTNITDDMSSQQKEKAQEVIVPTIMVRILSLAVRRFN